MPPLPQPFLPSSRAPFRERCAPEAVYELGTTCVALVETPTAARKRITHLQKTRQWDGTLSAGEGEENAIETSVRLHMYPFVIPYLSAGNPHLYFSSDLRSGDLGAHALPRLGSPRGVKGCG